MNGAPAVAWARRRFAVPATAWPLADQGLVSVGGFVVNLTLARGLPAEDYGVYALLFMAMLQVQVVSGSLLFYPLSVRGAVMDAPGEGRDQAGLFGTGLVLALGLTLPLGALLAASLVAAGHADLVAPAVLWLLLWQVQELLRRGLFTQMRHSAAIPGDAVRYGGQALALLALAATGSLTLAHAVTAMAVAAGVAAAWQAMQLRISFAAMPSWRATAAGFWRVGHGSLGSNLLATLSVQIYPWCLALFGGAAMAAGFQAALNVVMVLNPVLIGLCNVLPQTVAREARKTGVRGAWQASRGSMALGAAPMLAFFGAAAIWPEAVLALLYGRNSPYLDLGPAVRLMAVAAAIGFAVEMVNAFLHGIQQTRQSMRINATGLAASLLALPLTALMGALGSAIGMLCANGVRALAATRILTHLLADAPRR